MPDITATQTARTLSAAHSENVTLFDCFSPFDELESISLKLLQNLPAQKVRECSKFWQSFLADQIIEQAEIMSGIDIFDATPNLNTILAGAIPCQPRYVKTCMDHYLPATPSDEQMLNCRTTTYYNCGWCLFALPSHLDKGGTKLEGFCGLIGKESGHFQNPTTICNFVSRDPELIRDSLQRKLDEVASAISYAETCLALLKQTYSYL